MDRAPSPQRRRRACVPCSKAKARCMFEGQEHLCQRCAKMNIVCAAKTTQSLRKPRQIKPFNSRVSSLEQRLGTLVSTLEAQISQSPGACAPSSSLPDPAVSAALAIRTPESAPTPAYEARDGALKHQESGPKHPQQQFQPNQELPPAKAPATNAPSSPAPPLNLTWPQAERILCLFRERYMLNYPFVIVDRDVSAAQLLRERPFLFRAVMLVAAPLPVPRVQKMKRNVMAYLGTHFLVEDESDLDLLQGLLVCIAWGDFGNLKDAKITSLTYMALGVAHQLGITKIPTTVLRKMGMGDLPEDVSATKIDSMDKEHTPEEQRAFLGCYSLLSSNSARFGRMNPVKSQYVNICCDSLSWTQGYPSDFFLERTIRLVQMGEKISDAFGAAIDNERPKPYLFLVEGNARAFRAELDGIMASLGSDEARYESVYGPLEGGGPGGAGPDGGQLRPRRALELYYHFLLVRLYEPATYLQEASQEGGAVSLFRAACLRNCLLAARDYFAALLPPSEATPLYVFSPVSAMQQTSFVMIIATRLLLARGAPGWDVGWARRTLDFPAAMRRCAARLEAGEGGRADLAAGFVEEMRVTGVDATELAVPGRMRDMAEKSNWIADWFERRIRSEEGGGNVDEPQQQQQQTAEMAPGGGDVDELPLAGLDAGDFSFDVDSTGGPLWFGELLSNQLWGFDDFEL